MASRSAAAIKASNKVDLPLPWGPINATERGPATAAFAGEPVWRRGSYQNVSRETFWYDRDQKSYKAEDSGPFFNW